MKNNQTKWVMDYLDKDEELPEIMPAIDSLMSYARGIYYKSKHARLREWSLDKRSAYHFIIHVFTRCLLGENTYQALIGMCAPLVKCEAILDRAKCAAEAIAVISKTGLIYVERTGEDGKYMVGTNYILDNDIPEPSKHMPNFRVPSRTDSMILGNRFKQHDKFICDRHIQKMDQITLSLETRIIDSYIEESNQETMDENQQFQWDEFVKLSRNMYQNVISMRNKFFVNHNYDTRGRCYCEGYFINYQGSSYKKAIVQLANKEIIK